MKNEEKSDAIRRLLQNHATAMPSPLVTINSDVGITINIEQKSGDRLLLDQIESLFRGYARGQG